MGGEEAAYTHQLSDTVFVVDDDPCLLRGMYSILSLSGFTVVKFTSAEVFLENISSRHSGCVVTDIIMPGMSGLELQEELRRRNTLLTVILISGHVDVPQAVRAMIAGALDILEKPFGAEQLVDRVKAALAISRQRVLLASASEVFDQHLQLLTEREIEVFKLVIQGQANKEVARNLNISPRTVEIHRARIMTKFNVDSFAKLVVAAQTASRQAAC
jgi:two-component system response regulator FixJ